MTEDPQSETPKPSGLAGFWQELKRRKVMRVAITYAVVGLDLGFIFDRLCGNPRLEG